MKLSSTSLSSVLGVLSGLLSVISFFVLRLFFFIQAYPAQIAVICLLVLLALFIWKSTRDKNKEGEDKTNAGYIIGVVFALVLLVFATISTYANFQDNRKYDEDELVSDVTEGFLSVLKIKDFDKVFPWADEAILEDKGTIFIYPSSFPGSFETVILDKRKYDADPQHRHPITYNMSRDDNILRSEYKFAFVYTPNMNQAYQVPGARVLTAGINDVLKGFVYMKRKHWEKARECFSRADSIGNRMGTYLLSDWYAKGYGFDPDKATEALAEAYLRKAADGGCRAARAELGKRIVNDRSHSRPALMRAEDYLRKASVVETVVAPDVINEATRSLQTLSSFYIAEHQNGEAYDCTRRSYQSFNDESLMYEEHLNNCIRDQRYGEALDIIAKGEPRRVGNCYVSHAVMLMYGHGLGRDLAEAERLLRYAADSLDHYPAYKTLAELYRLEKRVGAEFFDKLYDVEFSNRVD